jgi:hypothetical protein
VKATGWLKGLEVTADGSGIVSHAGVALLRALADNTGLTGGLSRALASRRVLVHDRGRVVSCPAFSGQATIGYLCGCLLLQVLVHDFLRSPVSES